MLKFSQLAILTIAMAAIAREYDTYGLEEFWWRWLQPPEVHLWKSRAEQPTFDHQKNDPRLFELGYFFCHH